MVASGGNESNALLHSSQTMQRRVQVSAFVLGAIICFVLSFGMVVRHWLWGERVLEVSFEERINPNDASVASLMRLPGLGAARAAAIVEYRENALRAGATNIVFGDCNDMVKVKGLGPKTVAGMSRWLEFRQ
jgi:hypothetical protein